MMQSAGIVVNGVTVTWRNGQKALRDASFTVPGGSIAALLGVNGSGEIVLTRFWARHQRLLRMIAALRWLIYFIAPRRLPCQVPDAGSEGLSRVSASGREVLTREFVAGSEVLTRVREGLTCMP